MKPKKSDSQSADELLRQLQDSYLGDSKKKKRDESDDEDADDAAFRSRIAGLLSRLTGNGGKKSSTGKKRPAKEPEPEPEPDEPEELPEELPEAKPIEEKTIPAKKAPEKSVQKPKKQKKATPVVSEERPAAEELAAEEREQKETVPEEPTEAPIEEASDALPESQPEEPTVRQEEENSAEEPQKATAEEQNGEPSSATPAVIWALTGMDLPEESEKPGEPEKPEPVVAKTEPEPEPKPKPESVRKLEPEASKPSEPSKPIRNEPEKAIPVPAEKPEEPEKVKEPEKRNPSPAPVAKPTEPVKAEPQKKVPPEATSVHTEPPKADPPHTEPKKPEPPKAVPAHTEQPKPEPVRTEPSEAVPPKAVSSKTAQPKVTPSVTVIRPRQNPSEPIPAPQPDPDAIVIPAHSSGTGQNPVIVIKPRQAERPEPKLQTAEPTSAEPIRIGKRVDDAKLQGTPSEMTPKPEPIPARKEETPMPQNPSPEKDRPASTGAARTPGIGGTTMPNAHRENPNPAAPRQAAPASSAPKPQIRPNPPQAQNQPQTQKPTQAKQPAAPQQSAPQKPAEPIAPGTDPAPRRQNPGIGGTSLPGQRMASPRPPQKKHPAPAPRKPLPQDERLDEALDDDITETKELVSEPIVDGKENAAPARSSGFAHRRGKKQPPEENEKSATALAAKRSGLSRADIDMIFELGYEAELGRLVGFETLKKLRSEYLDRIRGKDAPAFRTAFGYRGADRRLSRENVLAAYAHDRKFLIFRLAATALLLLLLAVLDLPTFFGGVLAPYAEALPYLFPWLSVLLFVLAALLSLKQILAGLESIWRFTPSPYSLLAVTVLPTLVWEVVRAATATTASLLPLGFAACSVLLLGAVCDALRFSNELRTFRLISAERNKIVPDPTEPRKKKLRLGDKLVKILNDDIGENLYRVRTAQDLDGFFRRSNDMRSAAFPMTVLLAVAFSLTLFAGLTVGILTANVRSAFLAAAFALAFALPTSAIYLFWSPLGRANRRLVRRGCALIGEESVAEYRDHATLIFDDSEMFRTETAAQIAVRDGDDFRRDLRLAGILFRKLGGTVRSIGQKSPMRQEADPPVTLVRIPENGVEAIVDNRYHLLAGSAAFLAKSGVRVPKESTDRALRRAPNVALMYVAVDGVLKLSYEIGYTVKPSFEESIRLLLDSRASVAVQTYDPNLNDAFLQSMRGENADYIRVMKPGRYEEPSVPESSDAGAAALESPTDVCYPFRAAALIRKIRNIGYRLTLASLLPGAALAVLAVLRLPENLLPLLPLFAVAYRLFWLLVSAILGAAILHNGSLFGTTPEKPTEKKSNS